MAIEKTTGRSIGLDKIGVNRGSGFDQMARSNAGKGSAINQALTKYADQKINEIKLAEEAKGEKAAKSVDILYETVTNEDGSKSEIVTGYDSAEKTQLSSWATVEFEENIIDEMLKAYNTNGREIITEAQERIKKKITYKTTLDELNLMFDNEVEPLHNQVRDGMPKELQNEWDLNMSNVSLSSKAILNANHLKKRKAFISAEANTLIKSFDSTLPGLILNSPKDALLNHNITLKKMQRYCQQENMQACSWVESESSLVLKTIDYGTAVSPYLNVDMANSNSISRVKENYNNLILATNEPGKTVQLINLETGEKENFNLPDIKTDSEDEALYLREKIKTIMSGSYERLNKIAEGNADANNFLNIADMSIKKGVSYFTNEAENKKVRKLISDPNNAFMTNMLATFSEEMANTSLGAVNLHADNFKENPKLVEQFYTWFASKSGLMPEYVSRQTKAVLAGTNSEALRKYVIGPEFRIINAATFGVTKSNGNVIRTQNGKTGLGLSAEEDKQFSFLLDSIRFMGVQEGVGHYIDMEKRRKENGEEFNFTREEVYEQKGFTAMEFQAAVTTKIIGEMDVWLGSDLFVGTEFVGLVRDKVVERFRMNRSGDIGDFVTEIIKEVKDAGHYGESKSTFARGARTDDPEEVSEMAGFVKYPIEKTLNLPELNNNMKNFLSEKAYRALESLQKYGSETIPKFMVGTIPVFQENLFLELANNPIDPLQAVYALVYVDTSTEPPQKINALNSEGARVYTSPAELDTDKLRGKNLADG
tara:strand:+ start:60 stop:2357 length:2298 start_codon:yes stop_codon:yes gene_type:complete